MTRREPLAPRVLPRLGGPRLPCPTCDAGLVADYDSRGVWHRRVCAVCGGRGTVATGYALTSLTRKET